MNIDRILRKLREMNLTLKKEIWTEKMRYENENDQKNVINIDSDVSEEIELGISYSDI